MTLELADGRGELFQWDTGRIIEFGEDAVSQAHFTSTEKAINIPYTVEVKNGKAAIPDELLQVPGKLIVYAWVSDTNGDYTKVQVNFPVFTRPKPSDYVYTPTEHAGFDRLRAEIGDLADLQTDAKDSLVSAINEVAASGGADWAQNDPTAKDYVKNRTHWVENGRKQEDYTFTLNGNCVSSVENKSYRNGVIPLATGEQVQVTFLSFTTGKVIDQCIAIVAKDVNGEPCIDSPNGMPVTIYADHAKYSTQWLNSSNVGLVVVTRTVSSRYVHPINAEYLTNGQEKICWTEPEMTKLYANDNADFKFQATYFYITTRPDAGSFGLVAGKKYRVVWDSVPYDCTCISGSKYARNYSWIGNPALSAPQNEIGNGNEFPFLISTKRNGTTIESNGVAASRPGKHSFSLYELGDEVVHKIPDKYISHAFFEIKASSNGDINDDGIFKVTADKSSDDVLDALKHGKVPYVNFEDVTILWPADYGHGVPMFISSELAPSGVTMTAIMIADENSAGMRKEFNSYNLLYILRAEQGNYGYWYIEGKTISDWYTKIKENPSKYPILCLYTGTYNVKYEYEGPLFLDSITDTEIVYKRTLEDGNWVGFKLSAVDGSPSKNGFIKGVSKEIILSSSTADSTKKFKLTIDDSGALSAVEVTE